MRRAAASIVAAALLLAGSTTAAHAAPTETVVQGDVLRLVSVLDPEAMVDARPGVPVTWDVGVSASRSDGTIDVALESATTPGAFLVSVRACGERWEAGACASGAATLLDAPLRDGARIALARQPAAEVAWYRVEVVLQAPDGAARADLRLAATGMGDDLGVVGGSDGGPAAPGAAGGVPPALLPPTGLGAAAVIVGLAVAALATGVRWMLRSRARPAA